MINNSRLKSRRVCTINKITIVCFTRLLITIGFWGLFTFEFDAVGAANTLYVGDGVGGNLSSIQEAIDAASPGETIFIYDDSYLYNENIVVNKSVNLIGEDRDTMVIYGGGSGVRVRIDSDWVNLSGFTVTGMGPFDWDNHGVYIDYGSNIRIENVNVTENIKIKINSIPTPLSVSHTITRKEV